MPGPVKEHAWLEKFVGEWKTESKATMAPDQPPMQCSGTLVSRKLGGFWILNETKGEWSGSPTLNLEALQLLQPKSRRELEIYSFNVIFRQNHYRLYQLADLDS